MITSYDDPELEDQTDDPRLKRRPTSAPIGKPITGGPATQPIGTPIMPSKPAIADMAAPEMSSQPTQPISPVSSIGSPIAPRPAGNRLEQTVAQGPPEEHGLNRVLDTIAGSTRIGQAIESAGGFGTSGYDAKVARQEAGAKAEEGQIEAGQKERKSEADIQQEQTGDELVDVPLPGGGTQQVMRKNVATPTSAIINTAGKTDVANIQQVPALRKLGLDANGQPIPEEQLAPGEKQQINLSKAKTDLAEAQADFEKFKTDPNSPMYRVAVARMSLAEQNYDLRLKEFGYNYDPSTLSPQERGILPTDVTGNPVALHSPLKPSATTVSAAQRAANVVAQVPRLKQEVTDLQASLGPAAGRWNGFWQGTVGAPDPKFATIKDDMEYLSSAVALAHAYGRLPSSISDKFDAMYSAGKQDPKNMIAALDVAMEWLPKIVGPAMTAGERGNPTTPVAGGGAGTGAPSAPAPTGAAGGFKAWKAGKVGKP